MARLDEIHPAPVELPALKQALAEFRAQGMAPSNAPSMRRLLLLLLAMVAYWMLRRGRRTQPPRTTPRGAAPAAPDPMVRDRICNTFLPRSRARVLEEAGETLFFCSQACQERHAEAQNNL
jgi:YHS domain-containing protein